MLPEDIMTKILTAFFKKKRYFHCSFKHIWSLVSHVLCYFLYADLHKVSFPPHDIFFILMLKYIICTKTWTNLDGRISIWMVTLTKNLFFLLKQISLFDMSLIVNSVTTKRINIILIQKLNVE